MSALKLCPTCSTEYPANERFCPRDGTALRSQDGGTDLVGTIIGDRYHVIRQLGEGGMGRVYLAEHVKMGRKSAVKVMNPMMVQNADAISRFNREAANASRINHPHVAGIYDFGETSDGLIYLAMEYVEGVPLTELVQDAGALPPSRAAELTRQIGEGLSVAHEMGIVHRDLKPDNVMVVRHRDGSDVAKIVDFGIAKAANSETQKVTRTGLVVGTPEYMSPEQLSGDPLDGRSDIYSLGLVAFHMLTGGLPFPSNTVQESMIMRLTDPPARLAAMRPDVTWPPAVQEVMDRALQRDVALRYQSAGEFGRALVAAVRSMPTVPSAGKQTPTVAMGGPTVTIPVTRLSAAVPPTMVSAAPAPAARSRRTPMLVGAALLAVALVGGWLAFGAGRGSAGETGAKSPAPAARRDSAGPRLLSTGLGTSTGAADQGAGSVSPITISDISLDSQPAGAVPAAGDRGAAQAPPATGPATGQPTVTGVVAGQSYETELLKLWEQVSDRESALRVGAQIPAWRERTTLARDDAILQVIEAEVAVQTGRDARACSIVRQVRREDLGERLKNTYNAMMQSCEGT